MIITHVDGTVVDTDKLSDISAQIFEKTEELRKLCESANRPFLLFIDTKGSKSFTSFWNFKSGSDPDHEMIDESFARLANCAHGFFMSCSNGNLGVYPTKYIDPKFINPDNKDDTDE
jgi:lantibiotic modifying enzyme